MNNIIENGVISLTPFFSITIGILVLFLGRRVSQKVTMLREFSIPEPVTGGLFLSLLFTILFLTTGYEINFDLDARDFFLVYFFTTIGINARVKDLLSGGKPLIILLAVTAIYLILQNIIGISVASLLGIDSVIGLLGGSVSLIGGHGTSIAWSPQIGEQFNIDNAMEIGIACATFGLILASLMGGPIAKFLVNKHNLVADKDIQKDESSVHKNTTIDAYGFLDAIVAIHACIALGFILNEAIAALGLQLPLFVACLFAGISLSNLLPNSYKRISGLSWPARSPAIDLIAEISLGTFLAMSLMSLKLWTLVDLAGPMFILLAFQFCFAVIVAIFVVFPLMGKDYDAAVVCAGFGGISLGSTPTAMANMTSVTQRYGHSQLAFIIVPLVCAFFIDLINAVAIPTFLNLLG